MDIPKEVKGMSNFLSEKIIITFNHTCKILCDIGVNYLDSAELFMATVI